ncbi:MAG: hypothetical protein JNM17_08900, partial [Archangium sp.]|nr:hypothetical protein [Archangium sp.]
MRFVFAAASPLPHFGGAGFLFLATLALSSCECNKPPSAPPTPTVGDVKRVLAEREKRLQSYRIVVDTTEGFGAGREPGENGQSVAHHEFWFRSPNKSRGHMTLPQEVELAFDGTSLVRILYPPKVMDAGREPGKTVVEPVPLDLPPAQRAFFLASTFMPFAPEGFRTPLIPSTGVEISSASPTEVNVKVAPGEGVSVAYRLRWPSGDFLEKRALSNGKERRLKVLDEKCDSTLKLCVPV